MLNETLLALEARLRLLNASLAGLGLANVSLVELRELEARLARVEALVNASLGLAGLREEVGALRAGVRHAYAVAGVCGAVGIVLGYVLAIHFERGRRRGAGGGGG